MSRSAEIPPLPPNPSSDLGELVLRAAFQAPEKEHRVIAVALLSAALLHACLFLQNFEARAETELRTIPLSGFEIDEPAPLPEEEVSPSPEEDRAPSSSHSDTPSQADASAQPSSENEEMVDVELEGGDQGEEGDEAPDTLTQDFGGADWAAYRGAGSKLGATGSGRTGRDRELKRETVLAARDLSRRAEAPDLSGLVLRNYPVSARMARVEGTVTVSALVGADGNPSDVRVQSATPSGRGFGEACSRTVHEGPDWKPELNRDGRPVAVRATYTCKFNLPKAPEGQEARPKEATSPHVFHRPAR